MISAKLQSWLDKYTVPAEEAFAHFTPEQKRQVEVEIEKYYRHIRLRQARKAAKLTQAQLAKKAHLSRTMITKIESGHYNPTIKTLIYIADAMDTQLEIKFVAK